MNAESAPLRSVKRIALVAHDNEKEKLAAWAKKHHEELSRHTLFATGTTGSMLKEEIGLEIECLESGPLGGDMQIGARIADLQIDFLVFFWDPLAPQPHDPDVKALLRVAVVWNIPTACNLSTADFLLTSPWMQKEYVREMPVVTRYRAGRG